MSKKGSLNFPCAWLKKWVREIVEKNSLCSWWQAPVYDAAISIFKVPTQPDQKKMQVY